MLEVSLLPRGSFEILGFFICFRVLHYFVRRFGSLPTSIASAPPKKIWIYRNIVISFIHACIAAFLSLYRQGIANNQNIQNRIELTLLPEACCLRPVVRCTRSRSHMSHMHNRISDFVQYQISSASQQHLSTFSPFQYISNRSMSPLLHLVRKQ